MKPLLLAAASGAISLLIIFAPPPAWTSPVGDNSGSSALPNAAVAVHITENQVQATLFVDNQSPNATDQNPGTENLPFSTVSRAAKVAQANNEKGIGTRVYIKPGVYRERVFLTQGGKETDAPTIFEGIAKGSVVLSGSDIWTNWQKIGDNLYQHPWPYRWRLAPYPRGWVGNVTLDPIVRRREMVFVNGRSLTQVLNYSSLVNYSFYVAEDTGVIFIELGPDLSMDSNPVIEVAVRPRLFWVQGKRNVVLRNLTFRHGNAAVQDPAVEIENSTNVLVEGCIFSWNNWIGLGISGVTNAALYNNILDWNGATGLDGYNLKNLVLDGNETSSNNWRGALGNFYGWSVAGAKLGGVHTGSISHHLSANDLARGLWLDYDNNNITVDSSKFTGNYNDGIFVEANPGPILIEKSSITGNYKGAGIAGANSSDVTLINNTVTGNGVAQLLITGDFNRTVVDWESGAQRNVRAARWTIRSNTFGTNSGAPALQTSSWPPFLTSLLSQHNTWSKSGDPRAFRVDTSLLTFQQWQSLVHTDTTSVFLGAAGAGGDSVTPSSSSGLPRTFALQHSNTVGARRLAALPGGGN